MLSLDSFLPPQADQTGRNLSQIDLALGVPLLPSMLPAPLPEMTPPPAGSQAFRRSSPATYGDSGSNSNRAPSFESHLSRRSFEQQFDPVEDQPAPSSGEADTVGAPGRNFAESLANPRQRVGQETLSSGRRQHTRVETGQQESSAAGPSSSGSTAGQGQREGRAQADTIAPGEPYGRGGKVLASSQAASETASTSNTSGRFSLFVGEPLQALGGLQRPPGSDQLSQVQNEPGSTPRSITPLSTEVEPLEVVGERPIGGKRHHRVPPATANAAATHGVGLQQLGFTETSDSETLESNLPKVERPNQASPHPGDVSREGFSGAISSELPSETLQTGHGAAVGQQPGVKPVAVSETPTSAGQEVFTQPSNRVLEEPSRAVAALRARFSEKLISEHTERAVPHSRTLLGPMEESGVPQSEESSARDQQLPLSDQEARTRVFREAGSDSAVRREGPRGLSPDGFTRERFGFLSGGLWCGVADNPRARAYATKKQRPSLRAARGTRSRTAQHEHKADEPAKASPFGRRIVHRNAAGWFQHGSPRRSRFEAGSTF